MKLSDQVSKLGVSLLDRVRDGDELQTVLNERCPGISFHDNMGKITLPRLTMAIRYREKRVRRLQMFAKTEVSVIHL